MNDQFAPFLAKILGNANAVAKENAKEQVYDKAKHACHVHIGRKRIPACELPGREVIEVKEDYNSLTLLLTDGQYVHITAEAGYDNYIDFDTATNLEIEDAHNYGVLPDDLYVAMKDAQAIHQGINEERNAIRRLQQAVIDLGPEKAASFIAALKPEEGK